MPLTSLDTRRPFTRADALAAGISPRMLRGSRFRRIFRGVYIDSGVDVKEKIRAEAALVLHPGGAFVSHVTAARVLGLPVPDGHPDEHVSVFRESDRRPRPGLRSHVAPLTAGVIACRTVRVSSVVDTFLALASVLPLVDLVVVGDAIVRLGMASPSELQDSARSSGGRHAVAARRAAAFVRAGVDSPMETRLRMLIVLAGLPEPRVNHIVRRPNGDWVMRFDLSSPWLRLAVEYDGRQHAADTSQWQRDIERREILDRAGWRLVVVTAKGIYVEPARTLTRIHAALRECGCARLPRTLSAEWQPHFPGRASSTS